ncbi:MAG: undecaprenyl-phosphate glucose phosphotransferase, partial [Hyphomicrobium sp.]
NDKSKLISATVVRGLARAGDFLTATILGLAIALVYVNEPDVGSNPVYLSAIAATGLFVVGSFEVLGLYTIAAFTSILRQMPRIVLGWTIAFGLFVVSVFFVKMGAELSRVWLAVWYTAGAAALVGERLILSTVTRSWMRDGRLYRRAVLYGANDVSAEVIAELEADAESDIRISGIFDDRIDERNPRVIAGYPYLGGIESLVNFARETRIDLIIVALPMNAEQRLAGVLRTLSVLPVDIKLPARSSTVRFSRSVYSHIGRVPMFDLCDKPIADWGNVVKWLFDKTIAAVALVLLTPVMLAVATAIRLESRGSVLFRQKRYGFNNELIEVLKFRSMYTDRCDAGATRLVTKDDPRVTGVGRFIRKTSLDELPQLVNVLLGDLSLVGPRPHALQAKAGTELYDAVVDGYFARHKVKPGITGWAQINGWRGETDTEDKIRKRVEHDLYYIENWSIFLDLYILVKTPFALLKTENAY